MNIRISDPPVLPRRNDSPCLAVILCALVLALLTACAGTLPAVPKYSASDVVAAARAGTLEELYQKVNAELIDPELLPDHRVAIEAVKKDVADNLAGQLRDDIQRVLLESTRAVELLPVNVLEAQRDRITPIQTWSREIYKQISAELSAEAKKTNTAIAERLSQLDTMADSNVSQRLIILEELGALAGLGTESQQSYAAQRASLIEELNEEVSIAIEAEEYDKAREILAIVQRVDPMDEGTQEKIATVGTKAFERDFWQALENGDADTAYSLLTDISSTDSFELIRPKLAGSVGVMSNYFVSLGGAATAMKKAPEAYRRFREARNIRSMLGDESSKQLREELSFAKLVFGYYQEARTKNRDGLAWGYLKVVQSFNPDYPQLRYNLRITRDLVLGQAINHLTTTPFKDAADSQSRFGDTVTSNVVQRLFELIPNDVRIIEREQLSGIEREQRMRNDSSTSVLAAADYLVEGAVQESRVETIVNNGKRTMRVTTGKTKRTNPNHTAWLQLSDRDREESPEPPRTVSVVQQDDVTVEVTRYRKVGLFSVSYRVIDAETAKVIFASSVRKKSVNEDTSTEGVERGDFKVDFKLASLPSDLEILAGLVDEVSDEIGANLAEVLKDPEVAYVKNGENFVHEENFGEAAAQFAYAIALMEAKGIPVDELNQRLREIAIASGGGLAGGA